MWVLPLAITRVDAEHGCVGALARGGGWIRPEPIRALDVAGDAARYSYDRWVGLELEPSRSADARPEDRALVAAPRPGEVIALAERLTLLRASADASVEAAFEGGRSLGAIAARVRRVYIWRSTGRRDFVRMEFNDASGATYDWIVPDVRFDCWVRAQSPDTATAALAERDVHLALGLTKPNHRFPGRFSGCHPLVVGVHAVPDYPAEQLL